MSARRLTEVKSGDERRASGMRPRVTLPRSSGTGQPGMDALIAIGDLFQSGRPASKALPDLAAIMGRAMPLDATGVALWHPGEAPLVYCYCKKDERAEHDRVSSIVRAAAEYFRGEAPLDRFEALTSRSSRRWICLPLAAENAAMLGLIAVETSASLDEGIVGFVTCVARYLARGVADERRAEYASASSARGEAVMGELLATERGARAAAESTARTSAIASELAGLVSSSFEYMSTLRDLTRIVGSRVACACVVDIAGEGGAVDHIVHAPLHSGPEVSAALSPLVADVMRHGTAVAAGKGPREIVTDLVAEAQRACVRLRVDWLVCAPIMVTGRPQGAISVFGAEVRHAPLAVGLVEELARRIGLAVENAHLYEKALADVRDREQVLSTVSHDLKNPLGVILMSAADELETTPAADRKPSRRMMEMIQRNARRMQSLVADLLDFASLEAGSMSIRPTTCDARQLAHEAVEDARPAARVRGVEVVDELPATLPSVWVDPGRLLQVLTNLVGNAVKFTERGGRVVLRAGVLESDEVSVSIADTGRGIAPEELSHVFDRFWQSQPANRLGSGLGLAICKSIVERSGGRIWIESELGVGTTTTFTIPLARDRVG